MGGERWQEHKGKPEPGTATWLHPTAAAVLVLVLVACPHAGSTPRCCCHEGVSDDLGSIQVGTCGQQWR